MKKSNQHHTKKVTFFVAQKNEVIQVWDDMTENNDNSYFGWTIPLNAHYETVCHLKVAFRVRITSTASLR